MLLALLFGTLTGQLLLALLFGTLTGQLLLLLLCLGLIRLLAGNTGCCGLGIVLTLDRLAGAGQDAAIKGNLPGLGFLVRRHGLIAVIGNAAVGGGEGIA